MKDKLKAKFPGLFGLLKRNYYRLRRLNPFISSRYMYLHGGKYLDLRHFKSVEIKPNFFIIGAEKSGTTSLHHYLDQHPDIFMAKPNKESQYLLDIEQAKIYYDRPKMIIRNHHDILKNHVLRGYKGQATIGESSTSYTRGNVAVRFGVVERMKTYQPEPKLVYIVRHPLDRIVSNFLHAKRERNPQAVLDDELSTSKTYLWTSLYGQQLERYAAVVPKNRIQILIYEDFIRDPQAALNQIVSFLGLNRHQFDVKRTHNVGKNRKDFSRGELSFKKSDFERMMEQIEPDIKLLEEISDQKMPWTFKEKDWVRR